MTSLRRAIFAGNRLRHLYGASIVALVMLHCVLCSPAATCRDDLLPWQIAICFVAPLAVVIPSLVMNCKKVRLRGLLFFATCGAIVYSQLYLNCVMSARPRPGFRLGMVKPFIEDGLIISIHGLLIFGPLFIFCYSLDRLAEPCRRRVCSYLVRNAL
jgi:hypothetical protein